MNKIKKIINTNILLFFLFSKTSFANVQPIIQFDREFDVYEGPYRTLSLQESTTAIVKGPIITTISFYKRNLGQNLGQVISEYNQKFKENLKNLKIDVVNNYKILYLYNDLKDYIGQEVLYIFNKKEQCIGYLIFDSYFSIHHQINYPIIQNMKSFPRNDNYVSNFILNNEIKHSFYINENNNFIELYGIFEYEKYFKSINRKVWIPHLVVDGFFPKELESIVKNSIKKYSTFINN